ncbi:MAG TPA: alternative ribosome rescue aminoacyl-tRNA hydrolase ArfB [Thermoanaerobaculia bacterium]|nr:alternative ribosome rescue aminoacyl-tRNA hydrolase ArfB [Thermoanaerobaculia bacterium]
MRIRDDLEIPDSEIRFSTSRSGGPGGQNVNKLETRVTLEFVPAGSSALSDEQKAKIQEKLGTRISREGVLRVSSQKHRSQLQNRDAAVERFAVLIHDALTEQKPRRKTRPSRRAREKRLEEKKRRSETKRTRGEGRRF